MTDAPERIFACYDPQFDATYWVGPNKVYLQRHSVGEYVPADLVPAMLAAERAAVIEAALQELGYAAWRHEGDDSYSIGLEAGARRQSQADFDAIRALSDDAVTAARAKIESEGYRRGLEAAAALVETHVYTTNGDQRQMEPRAHAKDDMHHRTIAAAIRALIGGDDA